jgi:hypothetical protein
MRYAVKLWRIWVMPAPKGNPPRMGTIQWIEGLDVLAGWIQ